MASAPNYLRLTHEAEDFFSLSSKNLTLAGVSRIEDGRGQFVHVLDATAMLGSYKKVQVGCTRDNKLLVTETSINPDTETLSSVVYTAIEAAPFSYGNTGSDILLTFSKAAHSGKGMPTQLSFPVDGNVSVLDAICAAPTTKAIQASGRIISH